MSGPQPASRIPFCGRCRARHASPLPHTKIKTCPTAYHAAGQVLCFLSIFRLRPVARLHRVLGGRGRLRGLRQLFLLGPLFPDLASGSEHHGHCDQQHRPQVDQRDDQTLQEPDKGIPAAAERRRSGSPRHAGGGQGGDLPQVDVHGGVTDLLVHAA